MAGGIIPARAGFTSTPSAGRPTITDHPRSRGVYRLSDGLSCAPWGSSPLARGLPSTYPAGERGEDHPRSRGVYEAVRMHEEVFTGSSPLARGLPSTYPAGERGEDHPRSRGVYEAVRMHEEVFTGSSPLARGLLSLWFVLQTRERIIPARAGFTCSPPTPGRSGRDHPRSRGVYIVFAERIAVVAGSSPLARGLRHRLRIPDPQARIIPARAGFTSTACLHPILSRDHPRSRGVYHHRQ